MKRKTLKFKTIALAGLVVSGCTIPDFNIGQKATAPAPAQAVAAPVVKAPVAPKPVTATVPVETAATTPEPVTPRWGHQRIGNTPNLSDGDEDGGWN